MYTAEYYLNRGSKTLFWECIHQSITWTRDNKTLFWDVYIRVLPGTVVIRLCFGMYTSEYYLNRGNKTCVLGCIHLSITCPVVIRLCFGMYTSEYYLDRGNKT